MQVTIDIPEEDYESIKKIPDIFLLDEDMNLKSRIFKAVKEGSTVVEYNRNSKGRAFKR